MTTLSKAVTNKAIQDPEKLYTTPQDVLADERTTAGEKIKILDSWIQDEEALLRAAGENMPAQPGSALPASDDPSTSLSQLKKVRATLN